MIRRSHRSGDTTATAVYSDCTRYRYDLIRTWDEGAARLHFIMLNPSTATEARNDPTIARCEGRARRSGYGALRVTNLFAWRDTDPAGLRGVTDPVGPENDASILAAVRWADRTICAWGLHGAHLGRDVQVLAPLHDIGADLFHLGLTKSGAPRHPLYVAYDSRPERWAADGVGVKGRR